jgi:hypothetical protein
VEKRGFQTTLLRELAYRNIAAEFVYFVLDIREEAGGVERLEEG